MNLMRVFLAILPYALAAGVSADVTYIIAKNHYTAKIAGIQRDQAQAIAAARAADVETLKLAKRHGDALTLQLQVTESTLTKRERELHDAIRSKTTGRACLSGSVVRLLNNAAGDDATNLPTSAAVAAAADGTAARDTSFATDTDVAQWAANARAQYEICRARLNALIDW